MMITLDQPQWLWLLLPAAFVFVWLARNERQLRPAALAWARAGVRTTLTAALLFVLAAPTTTTPHGDDPAEDDTQDDHDAATTTDRLVYVAPSPWLSSQQVREQVARFVGDDNASRVWLRGAERVREVGLDDDASWEAGRPTTPLHRLVADLAGETATQRELAVLSVEPPSQRQQRALTEAGWQWQWQPLHTRTLAVNPVLAPLTLEPSEPELGTPVTVRTQLWLPVEALSRQDSAAGLRWRLISDSSAHPWQSVSLPDERFSGGGGGSDSHAGLVPVELSATLDAHDWPALPSAYDDPSSSEPSSARIARHLRLEVDFFGEHELALQRGVVFRPAPRWFVHTARTVDPNATRLVDLATRSGLEAKPVPRLPAEPELHDYAGGVIPLGRLVEFDSAQWEQLLRFVEHGGGLIVPTLRPGQQPGALPEPISHDAARRLATLLPVRLGPRSEAEGTPHAVERFDRDGDVARSSVLFMIDNSGSMAQSIGRHTRSHFVREAVKHALDNMNEEDHASIAFFDSNVSGRIGPKPMTDENRTKLKQFLDNYPEPSRATAIALACKAAVQMLIHDNAAVKHVVLLSDGMETVHPFLTAADWRERRDDFIRNGISCSVVGVGEEYDKNTLLHIYTPGSGHFHFTTTETVELYGVRIPQIFLREVRMAQERGEQLLDPDEEGEEPDVPLMAMAGQLGVELSAPFRFAADSAPLPPLLTAIQQQPWPTSTTVLTWREPDAASANATLVETSEARHPLLVSWPVGRGHVAAWGSGFGPEAMPDWHDWPEYAAFLGRWWRTISNPQPGLWRLGQTHFASESEQTITFEATLQRADGEALDPTTTRLEATLLAPPQSRESRQGSRSLAEPQLDADGRLRLSFDATTASNYTALRLSIVTDAGEEDEGGSQPFAVLPLPPPPVAQPYVVSPHWRTEDATTATPISHDQEPPAEDEPTTSTSTDPAKEEEAPAPSRPAHQWIIALFLLALAMLAVDVYLRR